MAHDDTIYYRHAGRIGFLRKFSLRARLQVLEIFMSEMQPSADTSILDVGVSLDVTGPETNVLEQFYPYRERLVCAGIGDGTAVCNAYPGIRFKAITPHAPLPFADGEFDIAYSNAVIEHAGSRAQQRFFLAELCRVSRRTFVVAPNRMFPVEPHTALPLINYLPLPWFRRVLKRTPLAYWADEAHLNPLFARELGTLFPPGVTPKIRYAGLGFSNFSSNIIAIR